MLPRNTSKMRERGIVLISSLLLLLVLTILGLSMFRSVGLQEKIAGNLREKHRALQAAESAQQYAEWWLTQNNNYKNDVTTCGSLLNANAGAGAVCTNILTNVVANVATVPWKSGTTPIGVSYTPPGMSITTPGMGTYVQQPVFYISQLGTAASGQGTVFQVDAVGYGATTDAIAVVESTYVVFNGTCSLDPNDPC
jgi:type IV pilus assembly protein PilX